MLDKLLSYSEAHQRYEAGVAYGELCVMTMPVNRPTAS